VNRGARKPPEGGGLAGGGSVGKKNDITLSMSLTAMCRSTKEGGFRQRKKNTEQMNATWRSRYKNGLSRDIEPPPTPPTKNDTHLKKKPQVWVSPPTPPKNPSLR